MKTLRAALLSLGLALVVALALASDTAYAGSSESCQSYATSNACRKKGVVNVSSSEWNAKVWSTMKNPTISIDVIGESWWTARETCNGNITYQQEYDGEVDLNDSEFYDVSVHLKHSCGGSRLGWSMGNHDFHESGYTHIYPYKEYPMAI
jgi:hypothetical protein